MSANSDIRVVELFAGVGGFRVGLERCSERFKTIWANQWEPGQAGQWAYKCYSKNCRYRHRDRPSAAARPSGGRFSMSGLFRCQHRCQRHRRQKRRPLVVYLSDHPEESSELCPAGKRRSSAEVSCIPAWS